MHVSLAARTTPLSKGMDHGDEKDRHECMDVILRGQQCIDCRSKYFEDHLTVEFRL